MSLFNKILMILLIKNIFMTKIKLTKNNLILLGHNKIIIILIKEKQDSLKFIVSLKIKSFTRIKTKTTIVMKLKSFLHNPIPTMIKKFKKMMINKTLLIKRLQVLELQQNSQLLNNNLTLKVQIKMLLSKQRKKVKME